MAYAVQEDPYHLGRAAIKPPVAIQGIEQIKNFLYHMQTDTDKGKMLEIVYAWAQHQTGWNNPILDDVTSEFPYFGARWLEFLRNYLKKINNTIEVSKGPSYCLQQYGDVHLMPKIIKSQ
eukprot:13798662-Ditylum_brightwellii.AAC.2